MATALLLSGGWFEIEEIYAPYVQVSLQVILQVFLQVLGLGLPPNVSRSSGSIRPVRKVSAFIRASCSFATSLVQTSYKLFIIVRKTCLLVWNKISWASCFDQKIAFFWDRKALRRDAISHAADGQFIHGY